MKIAVTAIFVVVVYLLPSLIGRRRHMHERKALFIVNTVLGWTILGWLFCLMWALNGQTDAFREEMKHLP